MSRNQIILISVLSLGGTWGLFSSNHVESAASSFAGQAATTAVRPQARHPTDRPKDNGFRSEGDCARSGSVRKLTPPLSAGRTAPGRGGWDEQYRGQDLDLEGSSLVYCEDFGRKDSLKGPILWAKQHADVGLAKFDGPGGKAYEFLNGRLGLQAYEINDQYRGANVQSVSADQAYQGKPIASGTYGYTCIGCYWEARVKFPRSKGGWGAFWLLTPDDPHNRGHLEVDVIEYYGLADQRGHHHSVHRWKKGVSQTFTDYTGMDATADFDWHTYGVDLRGTSLLGGKPAIVIYMDGKEVGRVARESDFFSKPFYYLFSMTLNPRESDHDLPQLMLVDYIRVFQAKR